MIQGEFGKYQIVKMVGMGGMSIVYRAVDQTLNRETALKILNVQRATNPIDLRRFQREVKVAQRLRHPNIIDIFEYGEVDGFAYLAMEYMPGGSLGERYANPVAQTLGDSAEVLKVVATALDFAHAQGVLHRDLKLSNILVSAVGQLTLSDFGLALLPDSSRITESGQTFGTPIYMSPEQVHGARAVDHRADIYSLGVIAYLLATGYYPFLANTSLQIMNSHLRMNPPLPSRLNPRLPVEMDRVLLKGLAKRPEDRYSSAGALANAFEEAIAPFASTEIIILTMQPTPIVEASSHFVVPPIELQQAAIPEIGTIPVSNGLGDVTPDLNGAVGVSSASPRQSSGSGSRVARWAAGLALLAAGIMLVVGLGSLLPNQQEIASETLAPEIGVDATATASATPTFTSTPTLTQTTAPSATITRTAPPTNTPRPSITPTRTLSGGQHTATQRAEQTAVASGTAFMLLYATVTEEDTVPTRTRIIQTTTAATATITATNRVQATTAAPTLHAPATNVPATNVPPTNAPATNVPAPTSVPPTNVPSTPIPPTPVPPTPVPPTPVPPTDEPLIVLPLPTIPLVQTLLPGLIG